MTIDGYEDVPSGDEGALVKAASQQPISVAICASSALQFYGSGIVGGKCCEELNHGVLVVRLPACHVQAAAAHPACSTSAESLDSGIVAGPVEAALQSGQHLAQGL